MSAHLDALEAPAALGTARLAQGYKTILVHAGEDEPARRRVMVAAQLGRRFEAQVTGIVALPFDPANDPAFGYLSASAIAEAERLHEQALTNGCQAFGEVVGSQASCRTTDAFPAEALVKGARRADLVVASSVEPDAYSRDGVDLSELVMRLGEPLLLLPPSAGSLDLRSVVVGWKDTRECRRAIADALPFLISAERVALVAVAGAEVREAVALELQDLAARLEAHGVAVSTEVISHDGASVLEQLVDAADVRGADLLVLGAYGRSRAREWLFGGVTTEALASCRKALLLSH